jgi:hypothetical protein
MTILTAILTHLDSGMVEKQLSYLRAVSPGSRFVVCHGGNRTDFEPLRGENTLFIEDPSLRGPHFEKSVNDLLRAVHENYVRDDRSVDLVYLIEYDHLILRGDFEHRLRELADKSNAGLFAKNASPRNDTNWLAFLKHRDDDRLNRFIAGISCRGDPETRWGCLGTGMLFRRDALDAFCSLTDAPPYYVELFVPTVVHHLGFAIVDIDAVADLYMGVRWIPEFSVDEAIAEKHAGRAFVHPFKQLDALDTVRDA